MSVTVHGPSTTLPILGPYGTVVDHTLFGHRKTAAPYTLGDYMGYYGVDAENFLTITSGGGTVAQAAQTSAIRLAVGATNGDRAVLSTKNIHRYQAGREHEVILTLQHDDAGNAGQIRRWGYFDDSDGLFFCVDGTRTGIPLGFVVRSSVTGSVVETWIPRTSWTIDQLDGYGPSGVNIDLTKGNIYDTQFQYLGVGGVLISVDGYPCHFEPHGNLLPYVYMKTANLPLRLEVVNAATSSASGMNFNCGNVTSNGGENPPEFTYGTSVLRTAVAANTEVYGLTLRLLETFGGQTNRQYARILKLAESSETNRASIRLLLNATLTNPTFAVTPVSGSGMAIDTAASAATGGVEIFYGFAPSSGTGGAANNWDLSDLFPKQGRKLRRWSATTADCDTLTMMLKNETVNTTDITGSITWAEIR